MADHDYTHRINELEEERRKNLRQAKRARKRSREAHRRGNRHGWAEAQAVARRHNREAQDNLKRIRILRHNREKANAAARLLRHRRSAGRASDGGKLYWFDGKQVRAELYPNLVWARKHGWKGYVTSGYRSPFYSQSLCYAMCGRPRCSGRCAGTASNHVRIAVDVTDYYTFAALMKRCPVGIKLFNALPYDRVHFSPSGR